MKRGYTLTEMICVIAIIAIVAALVFPVFISSRKQARVSSCMSNLSQLSTALHAYAGDNDDWAPPWSTSNSSVSIEGGLYYQGDPKKWKAALMSYKSVGDQYWCPLDPHRGKEFLGFQEPANSKRWQETSYMMNPTFGPSAFGSTDGVFRLNLTTLPSKWRLSPSETVYISDAIWGDPNAPSGVNRLIGNHDKGRTINAMYLDGHVKRDIVENL